MTYTPYTKNSAAWRRACSETGTTTADDAIRVLAQRGWYEAKIVEHFRITRWSVRACAKSAGVTLPGAKR